MPQSESSMDARREELDRIDRELLRLFDDRNVLVQALHHAGVTPGHVADAAGQIDRIVHEDSRERQAAGTQQAHALSDDSRRAILKHLSSACLSSVHQFRVAFLGPQHSYSHLAAIKYFGQSMPLAPVTSIADVFEAVERGDVATGIVPIENSTDGRVVDTLSMFIRRETKICGEVRLPIHHNLLSRTPRDEIKEVHSKPQALSQCRGWLARHLPQARLVEVNSTAVAAKSAAQTHGVGAVASMEAGREYGLDIVDANIEDNPDNVTRFAVLGLDRPTPTGDDKTAILFQINHEPGALADAMTVFKDHALNLTWIESFPSPQQPDEYLFFVELSGHRDQERVQKATGKLKEKTLRLTILGSYPRAV